MRKRMGVAALLLSGFSFAQGDLRGVWKAEGKAYLNLETSGAIVEPRSGKLPYRPGARTQADFTLNKRSDPDLRCFQPGVPRATALPYPFQIFQTDRAVYIAYQRVHSYRILYLDGTPHNRGLDFAMGDSRAHWEGSTLVADVVSQSDKTWLDAAGHNHSDQMHVVERYTRNGPDTISYEATVEDPQVFTSPWKIHLLLRKQKEAELTEDECDVDSEGVRHHVPPFKKR